MIVRSVRGRRSERISGASAARLVDHFGAAGVAHEWGAVEAAEHHARHRIEAVGGAEDRVARRADQHPPPLLVLVRTAAIVVQAAAAQRLPAQGASGQHAPCSSTKAVASSPNARGNGAG